MKREDFIILLLGLLLLAGMLITIFFGGEKSIHGVGSLPGEQRAIHNFMDGLPPAPNKRC